jgi:hypothetical protein
MSFLQGGYLAVPAWTSGFRQALVRCSRFIRPEGLPYQGRLELVQWDNVSISSIWFTCRGGVANVA